MGAAALSITKRHDFFNAAGPITGDGIGYIIEAHRRYGLSQITPRRR